MAKIKGICKNIDGCDLAADKVEQEVDSFDFRCQECGKELSPLEDKKKKKKTGIPLIAIIAGMVVLLVIIIGIFALSGGPKVEKLTLDKSKVTFKLEQTDRLTVTVEPKEVQPELIWKSSDENVVTVNNGVVTAKAPGKAIVTVVVKNNEEITASCEYTVIEEDINMETLDIVEDPIVLRPGGHQQLTVKFTPENQNENISWSSSDESIVKVSPKGKLEALKVGQVNVIVKSDRTGLADTAVVSVEGPYEQENAKEADAKSQVPTSQPTSKPASQPSSKPVVQSSPKPVASSGSRDLGYATFKGSWPNDVSGRMIFKTSHVIDSRDPKKRVASAGDYVIGEWSDGHLVQGIWYGSDNQVKGSVIIGK